MRIIGLTGGIASGKSTVANMIVDLTGGKHINTDKLAHEAYAKGTVLYEQIVNIFGKIVLGDQEQIDRRVLGGIVFMDVFKMRLLNGLVWPVVKEKITLDVLDVLNRHEKTPINIIIESALSVSHPFITEKWLVTAPKWVAVARLKKRNLISSEEALARWHKTSIDFPDDMKIIENDGNYDELAKKVKEGLNVIDN